MSNHAVQICIVSLGLRMNNSTLITMAIWVWAGFEKVPHVLTLIYMEFMLYEIPSDTIIITIKFW